MSALFILLCQVFDPAPFEEVRLPRITEFEAPVRAGEPDQHLGLDVYALWTRWDDGLRLEDEWGFGADLKYGIEWGKPVMLVVKLGYAGWYTENDAQQTTPGAANVSQYRFGVGGDFATKYFDFGIFGNLGLYHFHSRPNNDTARFFEIQAILALKPIPQLRIGITGMVTWVGTDYNRASTHTWTNHSVGPIIELMF